VVVASAIALISSGPSLARPKSSNFTRGVPLEPVSITFAGFRSRWMMPRACAPRGRRRSARPRRAPARAQRARPQSLGQRPAFHVLHHEEVDRAAGTPAVRDVQGFRTRHRAGRRCSDARGRRPRAFVFEPAEAVGVRCARAGRILMATVRPRRVSRLCKPHPSRRPRQASGFRKDRGGHRTSASPNTRPREERVPRGRASPDEPARRAAAPIILALHGNDGQVGRLNYSTGSRAERPAPGSELELHAQLELGGRSPTCTCRRCCAARAACPTSCSRRCNWSG